MEGEREEGKVGASGGVGAREGGSEGDGTARPTKDKPKNCLNSYIHEKCDSTHKSEAKQQRISESFNWKMPCSCLDIRHVVELKRGIQQQTLTATGFREQNGQC